MSMRLDNLTFKGGIHVPDNKYFTNGKAIEIAREPHTVFISLHQHIGVPCEALVSVGDNVKVGQKIGDSKAKLSAPVHSSVSGVVKGIVKMYTTAGMKSDCIEIESDGLNEIHQSIGKNPNIESLSKEKIGEIIREAGLVGLGGAAFPLHAKLVTSDDGGVDTVILNGAECEPYLTCDHRIMLEQPEKVVVGLEIIRGYINAEHGYIAVENNKMDAIEALRKAVKDEDSNIAVLKTKFPQGDSYRIINAVIGRIVPKGGRGKDVGALVSNVNTAFATAEAIIDNKPLYERVITITGNGIKEPKNLMVKVGTPIKDLIEQCGGFNGKPGKILAGGPMTGMAQFSLDAPVVKATSGIVVLTEEEAKAQKVLPCIKCGKCLEVCPIGLQPLFISAYALKDNIEAAQRYDASACIRCGSCSFVCPSKRPLTESIGYAIDQIKASRKKS